MGTILTPTISIKKDRTLTTQEATGLIIDYNEQHIERPKKDQKTYYSEKKKKHTLKTEFQITTQG
jgi:hypothetical protein